MPELYVVQTGQCLGVIDEEELAFLRGLLVDEGPKDRDYYLDRHTLELLDQAGCPQRLLGLLGQALGLRPDGDPYRGAPVEPVGEGVEVGWR